LKRQIEHLIVRGLVTVRLELHKVRKYQSKMNLVEEEAKLIEHRDKLKSDRIMDAKKQMEARRNRRQRGMRL
jgi:hypothetical protein